MRDVKPVRLSDLCSLVTEQIDPKDRGNEIYVGLEHLAPGRFEAIGKGQAGDVRSSKNVFQRHDVLYGKLRPYLDKAVLASGPGICTTELLVLRAHEDVDPRFLTCVVHAPSFIAHAVAGATGVQHPRTSWQHIADFALPEFALDEQAKIANLIWAVYRTIAANEATSKSGEELKRAAMRTLFTRGLRGEVQKDTELGPLPESWTVAECEDLADAITVGVVVRPASYYVDKGVPALRSLNIKEDRIDTSSLVYFSSKDNDTVLSKSRLKSGDVLVVRTGYPGTSCVVPEALNGANCIDLVIVKPKTTRVKSEYLSRFLNSDVGKSQALTNSHGLAQQHLNVGAVRRLRIPLPPTLEEQREVVAVLEAIDRKFDLHRRKRVALDNLFSALLEKLVTGDIRVGDLDLSMVDPKQSTELAV